MAEQKGLLALLEELADLRARNKALERKTEFLQQRLEQRYRETVNEYKDKRQYFDRAQDFVFSMFLDLGPTEGLTRTEIPEEFKKRFPHLASVDSLRRAYELAEMGKLWKKQELDGVRFYLKLQEETAHV